MCTSLASLINFAIGASQFNNQLAVNDGSLVFSVNGYLIPNLSKAFAIDLAAKISTGKPDSFVILI